MVKIKKGKELYKPLITNLFVDPHSHRNVKEGDLSPSTHPALTHLDMYLALARYLLVELENFHVVKWVDLCLGLMLMQ